MNKHGYLMRRGGVIDRFITNPASELYSANVGKSIVNHGRPFVDARTDHGVVAHNDYSSIVNSAIQSNTSQAMRV